MRLPPGSDGLTSDFSKLPKLSSLKIITLIVVSF